MAKNLIKTRLDSRIWFSFGIIRSIGMNNVEQTRNGGVTTATEKKDAVSGEILFNIYCLIRHFRINFFIGCFQFRTAFEENKNCNFGIFLRRLLHIQFCTFRQVPKTTAPPIPTHYRHALK